MSSALPLSPTPPVSWESSFFLTCQDMFDAVKHSAPEADDYKATTENLKTFLRHYVTYPVEMLEEMARIPAIFADTINSFDRDLLNEWKTCSKSEKAKIGTRFLNRAYDTLSFNSDYIETPPMFSLIESNSYQRGKHDGSIETYCVDGRYTSCGRHIEVALGELSNASAEIFFSTLCHEASHDLVNLYQENMSDCFNKNDENCVPAAYWSMYKNRPSLKPFYEHDPEEALVRHMSIAAIEHYIEHYVDVGSIGDTDGSELLSCIVRKFQLNQILGNSRYEEMKSAEDFLNVFNKIKPV